MSEADLVVPTISQTLGLKESVGLSPLDALRGHLREKRMLLVLDNFEHVAGAATEVAGLIWSSKDLTALVTSRAPLRIRGEQEYPVPTLGLPASTLSPDSEEVLGSPSGRLFVERPGRYLPPSGSPRRMRGRWRRSAGGSTAYRWPWSWRRQGSSSLTPASLGEESLGLFRELEDRAGIAMVLSNLGEVAEEEGEYGKAAAFYQESLDLYRELGEKRGIALLAGRLGRIARIQADYGRATELYDESLLLHRELGDRLGISQDLEGMAAVRAARGQPEPAVRLWAAAEALREAIGAPPKDVERARYQPLVAAARETLSEEAFATLWAEGRGLTPEHALDAW